MSRRGRLPQQIAALGQGDEFAVAGRVDPVGSSFAGGVAERPVRRVARLRRFQRAFRAAIQRLRRAGRGRKQRRGAEREQDECGLRQRQNPPGDRTGGAALRYRGHVISCRNIGIDHRRNPQPNQSRFAALMTCDGLKTPFSQRLERRGIVPTACGTLSGAGTGTGAIRLKKIESPGRRERSGSNCAASTLGRGIRVMVPDGSRRGRVMKNNAETAASRKPGRQEFHDRRRIRTSTRRFKGCQSSPATAPTDGGLYNAELPARRAASVDRGP